MSDDVGHKVSFFRHYTVGSFHLGRLSNGGFVSFEIVSTRVFVELLLEVTWRIKVFKFRMDVTHFPTQIELRYRKHQLPDPLRQLQKRFVSRFNHRVSKQHCNSKELTDAKSTV